MIPSWRLDSLVDDLAIQARRLRDAAEAFDRDPLHAQIQAINDIADQFGKAWSGSSIGYHSTIYFQGFRPAPPGEYFDSEWGRASSDGWKQYDFDFVWEELWKATGVKDRSLLGDAAKQTRQLFEEAKFEIVATLDALIAQRPDRRLQELRQEATEVKEQLSREVIARSFMPNKFASRDSLAMHQGIRVPPHLSFLAMGMETASTGHGAGELARIATQAYKYLEKSWKMTGGTVARKTGRIFIGHGRSQEWLKLKEFLRDRLRLEITEFNVEPVAGITNTERLQQMLDESCFALLVMTAEDEHADSTRHARENVIHEAGLFQGRLGVRRAIIMLEEGCTEFSNIVGLVS